VIPVNPPSAPTREGAAPEMTVVYEEKVKGQKDKPSTDL